MTWYQKKPIFIQFRKLFQKVAPLNQPNRILTAIINRPVASLMVLVLVLLASVMGAFQQSKRIALERVELLFDSRKDGYRNSLGDLIEKPLLVPEVLASSKTVRALISRPNLVATREQNEILEEVARAVHVDVIYLMDMDGNTLSASNWRAQDSFVGNNYKFGQYFQQAIAGQTGRYTVKELTSLKVAHYLARPVTVDGKIRGAAVAKISFDIMQSRIEELWRRDKEMVLVTDVNGVVIGSPLSPLLFKAIQPIPETVRKEIETSRRYGAEISPVSWSKDYALTDDLRFVDYKDIPDRSFLQKSYYFPDLGLRLYLHIPASRYWEIVAEITARFLLLALVIFLVCISLFQRWVYAAKQLETAIRDPLTGLNTRLYMNDWCHAAISTHNRDSRAGIGLVVFDLDLFKQINDEHGHLAGDEVLKQVGEIIRTAIRGGDLAVRFGGEELAVFLRCADQAEAVAFAERIRHSVEHAEFKTKTGRIPVTLSGGVAYHAVGETTDALFARADKKLYEAKELGRNRIRD